eukprot:TRINITY_DN2600_c0_g1_i3.p1 TRINITY_DN2600_c0_g1~~TRINITY_DN2600_c0_g1_i3.p1  ORF type:complete len:145 (-),score=9.76 TRINITY_DN2600_c0_g1_i3:348-782(-)
MPSLVGSEMCIRDRYQRRVHGSPFLKKMLDDELSAMSESSKTAVTTIRRQLEKSLTEIRSHGIARATGSLTPGINGFSAPVYDHTGSMVAAITSLGSMGEFDVEWESPVAKAMLAASISLSHRLGYGSMAEQLTGAPERNRTAT